MAKLEAIRQRPVAIELSDGKPRTLKYTLNSFADLEEVYGNFEEALNHIEKGSMKALRAMLWAGIVEKDDDTTPKMIGALIDPNDLEHVTQVLLKALGGDLPQQGGAVSPQEVSRLSATPNGTTDPNVIRPQ